MDTDANAQRYAPPEGYYDRTSERPISNFLAKALDVQDFEPGLTALDFGCGAGNQTLYLLNRGYLVTAVDGNQEATEYIGRLPHQDRINFIKSDFETFDFAKYNLINSLHALSFTHRDKFDQMFIRLKDSLKPEGIFAGQFYGENDEWNKSGETMTFFSKIQVENLFNNMNIISFEEKDEVGEIADGTPKHWHLFNVVAKT